MSDQFVAEIRIFGFNFAPKGWALCNGQLLPISQNTALFSLLGTTYGGDGKVTFALPDLMGSIPIHIGRNQPGPGLQVYDLGQTGGEPNVTLLQSELPFHSHSPVVTTATGTVTAEAGNEIAKAMVGNFQQNTQGLFYSANPPQTALAAQSIGPAGGSLPHNNIMPTLVLNYCIALQGIFPARN
uniref:Tail Collar domain protein n=1 Tax=Caulobacter sp. (strain K31) TaxID=366602 RepID=B0SX67_CAUSK